MLNILIQTKNAFSLVGFSKKLKVSGFFKRYIKNAIKAITSNRKS